MSARRLLLRDRTIVGTPCFRIDDRQPRYGRQVPAPGLFVHTDNQAELLPQILAERARRALYAACERRPLSIDADCLSRSRRRNSPNQLQHERANHG